MSVSNTGEEKEISSIIDDIKILNDDDKENVPINDNTNEENRPYKSMQDFYKGCFYVMKIIHSAVEKCKDFNPHSITQIKWIQKIENCLIVTLTGYIEFSDKIDDNILVKKGYESGESCIVRFKYKYSCKMMAKNYYDFALHGTICDISIVDESNKIYVEFDLNNGASVFKNEREFLKFMSNCIDVDVTLIGDPKLLFEDIEKMTMSLEPLWYTDLGKIILSHLVNGFSYTLEESNNNEIKVSSTSNIFNLNCQQMSALELMNEKYPICYIQSPPGTGKTTVAASIICQNPNYKYIATAESNKACDAIAEALYKKINSEPSKMSDKKALKRSNDLLNPIRVQSNFAKFKNTEPVPFSEDELCMCLCKKNQLNDSLFFDEKNVLKQYYNAQEFIKARTSETSFSILAENHVTIYRLNRNMKKIFKNLYKPNVFIATSNLISKSLTRNYGSLSPDIIIIDETSQMTVLNFILFASHNLNAKYVLFGDYKQLQPFMPIDIVIEKPHDILTMSIIEFLASTNLVPNVELVKSYRMHPEILSLASNIFYESKLVCGVEEEDRKMVIERLESLNNLPMMWFDTKGSTHMKKLKTSTCNVKEAEYVKDLVKILIEKQFSHNQIGIICMYRAQVKEITSIVGDLPITIDTVDSYQGNEKDIIILCTSKTSIGDTDVFTDFLDDPRRINVAITRARCGLFIFGDIDHLMQFPNWKKVGEFFVQSNAINHAEDTHLIFT